MCVQLVLATVTMALHYSSFTRYESIEHQPDENDDDDSYYKFYNDTVSALALTVLIYLFKVTNILNTAARHLCILAEYLKAIPSRVCAIISGALAKAVLLSTSLITKSVTNVADFIDFNKRSFALLSL